MGQCSLAAAAARTSSSVSRVSRVLYGENMDARAGIRALRSAAAFDTAAAATAHVSVRALRASLWRLEPRGACAAAVAEASLRGRVQERAAALAHQACPPAAVRAAASDRSEQARAAASGAAGWAGRPLAPSASRRAVAVAASGDLCSDMNNGSDGDPEMLDLCADSGRPASFTQQQPEAVRAGPHRL